MRDQHAKMPGESRFGVFERLLSSTVLQKSDPCNSDRKPPFKPNQMARIQTSIWLKPSDPNKWSTPNWEVPYCLKVTSSWLLLIIGICTNHLKTTVAMPCAPPDRTRRIVQVTSHLESYCITFSSATPMISSPLWSKWQTSGDNF